MAVEIPSCILYSLLRLRAASPHIMYQHAVGWGTDVVDMTEDRHCIKCFFRHVHIPGVCLLKSAPPPPPALHLLHINFMTVEKLS
jgi:hypothetical protein